MNKHLIDFDMAVFKHITNKLELELKCLVVCVTVSKRGRVKTVSLILSLYCSLQYKKLNRGNSLS